MEDESKVSVDGGAKSPNEFNGNPRIAEILEIVLNDSIIEKEMESILLNFWNKYNSCIQKDSMDEDSMDEGNQEEHNQAEDNQEEHNQAEDNQEEHNQAEDNQAEDNQKKGTSMFGVLCMYMLDYVLKRNGPTICAVARSLYCYMKHLNLSDEDQDDITNGTENEFLNALREFTNFSSAEGKDILIDALIKCALDGNYGLSLFLLKFGLLEIPNEDNEKSRKIVDKLVDKFNDILQYTFANEQVADLRQSIEPKAMLDLMRRSNINLRRIIMTFFVILVISELRLLEKIKMGEMEEMELIKIVKKIAQLRFSSKLICLYQIFDETTEAYIKFRDIEFFIVQFLCPLLGADFGMSLVQFSRNNLCEHWDPLHPRSLKDLTRSIIRNNLQKSMLFPEQVSQFQIPVDLKEFLLHDYVGIFGALRGSRQARNNEENVRLLIDANLDIDLEI